MVLKITSFHWIRLIIINTTITILLVSTAAADFTGNVVRIIDGDTVVILRDKQKIRVRLSDIDAPEKKQPFGEQSKKALSQMIFQQKVRVVENKKDIYGRTLGTIFVEQCMENLILPLPQMQDTRHRSCFETNVNAKMVRDGMAWAYRHRAKTTNPQIMAIEQEARNQKRGLWAQKNPIQPSNWRKKKTDTEEKRSK